MRLDVHQRVLHWKHSGVLSQGLGFDRTQRCVVVEDVDAAAESAHDEIVLAFLNVQIAHGDRRHTAFELNPFLSAVHREEQTKFSSGEQQVWIHVIFRDGPNWSILRQVRAERSPGSPGVSGLQQVRFEVGVLVIVESDICRVCIVIRSDDAADVRHVRNAWKLLDLAPRLAAVFGDLQQAVVRADVDQAVFLLRLGECGGVAEECR